MCGISGYINFKDKKYVSFNEFKEAWRREAPEVHIMIATCEYKKSVRFIFKYKDKRLTYYLKRSLSEKMLIASCICYLQDILIREWERNKYIGLED